MNHVRLTRTLTVANARTSQLKPRKGTSSIRQKDLDRAYVVGFLAGAIAAAAVCIFLGVAF